MSDATLTHKDLANLLSVSETTVKSYRRKFPDCIPVASKGKPIRFTPNAASVATRIRDFFETGMSVEEVRSRLAMEFAWIAPEPQKSAPARSTGSAARPVSDNKSGMPPPELSVGMNNMAKSMVSMTQQQKAFFERMQGMEAMLEKLGLNAGDAESLRNNMAKSMVSMAQQQKAFLERMQGIKAMLEQLGLNADDAESLRNSAATAARRREDLLEQRLGHLDAVTQELTATVQALAKQLEGFLAQRAKTATAWQKENAGVLSKTTRLAVEEFSPAGQPSETEGTHGRSSFAQPDQEAKVIPLRLGLELGNEAHFSRQQTDFSGYAAQSCEPPRHFFSLPLVVRTEQGQYISVGVKSRGGFSLNDLKAMLIHGFTPPNHFTLRWKNHGRGWWLSLEQEAGPRFIHLLLMELPTQKGRNVAEVLQVRQNGDALHPAEIRGIINSFSA